MWAADVTYIPMACGFLYLVAIIDWASRAVLAWRLSNTNDASFCAAALEEALLRFGKPQIFNTDQGSTFTAEAFTSKLVTAGVEISMDGRGRFMDNIFIERLWRSIKYEEVHLKAYADGLRGAVRHRLLDELLQFSAPSPGDEQPDADGGVARRHGQNRGGGEGCGYAASLGQRKRVAHIPTAETEAARSGLILEGQEQARLHLKSNPPWSHQWGPVHFAKAQPISRAGKPEDIAQAAACLASDASTFVNGRDLVVDGGLLVDRPLSMVLATAQAIATKVTAAAGAR